MMATFTVAQPLIMIQKEVTISAQDKWNTSDMFERQRMLARVDYSPSFAKISWKKLPSVLKKNLELKQWTA